MSTRLSIADGLAVMALLLAGVAAATGHLVSGLYRDMAEMVREARAAETILSTKLAYSFPRYPHSALPSSSQRVLPKRSSKAMAARHGITYFDDWTSEHRARYGLD